MATHRSAGQRGIGPGDALQRLVGKAEGPLEVISLLTLDSATYKGDKSAVIPCHMFHAVSLLITVSGWVAGSSVKLMPQLGDQDIQEDHPPRYNDSTWLAKFDNSLFYAPMERTQAGGGSPVMVPMEVVIDYSSEISTFRATVMTRGAKQLRLLYARTGATNFAIDVKAVLHSGAWAGWA